MLKVGITWHVHIGSVPVYEAAIVEFYDIRSGHMLLAASQGTAVPWVWQQLVLISNVLQ